MAIHKLCVVIQNFKWLSLITGLASKFDFHESGRATFNPSIELLGYKESDDSEKVIMEPKLIAVQGPDLCIDFNIFDII